MKIELNVVDKASHDLNDSFNELFYLSSPGEEPDLARINKVAKEGYIHSLLIRYLYKLPNVDWCRFKVGKGFCKENGFIHQFCDGTKDNEDCSGCDFQEV